MGHVICINQSIQTITSISKTSRSTVAPHKTIQPFFITYSIGKHPDFCTILKSFALLHDRTDVSIDYSYRNSSCRAYYSIPLRLSPVVIANVELVQRERHLSIILLHRWTLVVTVDAIIEIISMIPQYRRRRRHHPRPPDERLQVRRHPIVP